MVTRTVLIDSAVRRAAHRQLVIIGAGLDTRPWRMGELAGCALFCVDQPASQADCRQRVAALQPVTGRLHWVAADLAVEPLGATLATAGHDPAEPTTWLWEGVVPYLTRRAVHATVEALSERSAVGSTLIVHYQDRSLLARIARRAAAFAARHGGPDDPMANEPWRSLWTPKQMAALLQRHGFTVERDVSLFTAANWIDAPTTHRRALANGHVAVATRRATTPQATPG